MVFMFVQIVPEHCQDVYLYLYHHLYLYLLLISVSYLYLYLDVGVRHPQHLTADGLKGKSGYSRPPPPPQSGYVPLGCTWKVTSQACSLEGEHKTASCSLAHVTGSLLLTQVQWELWATESLQEPLARCYI